MFLNYILDVSPGDRTDEQIGKNWFYSDRIRSESVTRIRTERRIDRAAYDQ